MMFTYLPSRWNKGIDLVHIDLRTMEEKWDGVKLIGRWHEAGNKGFMVVEAEDAVSLGKYSNQWTDLCDISIVPVMTDEEVGQVLSAS